MARLGGGWLRGLVWRGVGAVTMRMLTVQVIKGRALLFLRPGTALSVGEVTRRAGHTWRGLRAAVGS